MRRAIWISISYCLQKIEAELIRGVVKGVRQVQAERCNRLLVALLSELYVRTQEITAVCDEDHTPTLFDATVLVLVSRCIDKKALRLQLKEILLGLPFVPNSCIYLIGILATRRSLTDQDKSMVRDLMPLLCEVAMSAQSTLTREQALKTVLWFCVAEEFDVRIKAITFLAKDVMHQASDSTVLEFAVQAAINAVSIEAVRAREANLHQISIESETTGFVGVDGVVDLEGCGEVSMETVESQAEEDKRQGEKNGDDGEEKFETIYDFARRFDRGLAFGRPFSTISLSESKERVEEHVRRHLHLLTQVVLAHPDLLPVLIDLFAVSQCVCLREDTPASAADVDFKIAEVTRADCVKRLVTAEICNVLPVVLQSHPAEEVLDMLSCVDPLAQDLVLEMLRVMFKEDRIPPSIAAVNKVREIASYLPESSREKALVPVIGGLAVSEVETLLSSFIKNLGGSPQGLEELDRIFARVYRARPPPMTKAALLLYLHR
jgi:hypothetical protein